MSKVQSKCNCKGWWINEDENEPFEHVYEVTNCYSDGTYGPFKINRNLSLKRIQSSGKIGGCFFILKGLSHLIVCHLEVIYFSSLILPKYNSLTFT